GERERGVAEELIENFQNPFIFHHHSTSIYISQSQTEVLYKICFSFIFPSETKCSLHSHTFILFFLSFSVGIMRPEKNPLDLNNLPDEYSRDGKQLPQDSSSSGCRKKKNGFKDGIDECEKILFPEVLQVTGSWGTHEPPPPRLDFLETETLNHARQLVYRNDNLSTQAAPHLGCCQPIVSGGYHPASSMGDPTVLLRFPRYMSASSPLHMPPPHAPSQHQQPSQNILYASPPPPLSFPSPYSHPVNNYYMGHVLGSGTKQQNLMDYTCIGTPVGQALAGGGKDRSLQNQEEELNWGRGYSGTQQRLDTHSTINRFQDGF
ncbi:Zinc finger protein JAGGED, partial [Mucuna pruriens]